MKRIIPLLFAMVFAALAPAQTTQPAKTTPLIGVWFQPVDSFAKWKLRGINTLVGYEDQGHTVTKAQWKAGAKAAGLFTWIQSDVLDAADLVDPNVTGILLKPDEPDGVGQASPAVMQAKYQAVRAMLAQAGRNLPIWLDCDGNKIPYGSTATYAGYAQAADVLGEDVYPFNMARVEGIPVIASNIKKLQQAGGKPVIAVIECSPQDLNKQPWTATNDSTGTPLGPKMRGPTAAEEQQELQTAANAGVVGIIYFSDQIGRGWEGYDGTPADVVTTMTTFNTAWAKTSVNAIPLPPLPAQPTATTRPATQPTTKPALPVTISAPGYVTQTVQLQPQ